MWSLQLFVTVIEHLNAQYLFSFPENCCLYNLKSKDTFVKIGVFFHYFMTPVVTQVYSLQQVGPGCVWKHVWTPHIMVNLKLCYEEFYNICIFNSYLPSDCFIWLLIIFEHKFLICEQMKCPSKRKFEKSKRR